MIRMTIGEALNSVTRMLKPIAATSAAFEARQILCHTLNVDVSWLLAHTLELFPGKYQDRLTLFVNDRLSGKPLQYILGQWEFMGLPFYVREGVLIPRQDTETLAERAISHIRERKMRTVLDMCCGSGCIGVALARYTGVCVTLSDVSAICVQTAGQNAQLNRVEAILRLGDLFGPIKNDRFDLIVANPPYIPSADIPTLQPEVRREPASALCGGEDGLDFYRRIAQSYAGHLNPGGMLMLEFGINQSAALRDLFPGCHIYRDLRGIERVLEAG